MKYFGECTDCGQKFKTCADFTGHFTRDDNQQITGCSKPARKSKTVN